MKAPPGIEDFEAPSFALGDVTGGPSEGGLRGRPAARSVLGPDDLSGLPGWVSVQEASFLAEVPPSIIEGWSESGTVGTTRLPLGRGSAIVLLRTADLQRAPQTAEAQADQAFFGGPAQRGHLGRRTSTRLVQVAVAVIVGLGARAVVQPLVTSPGASRQNLQATAHFADLTPPPGIAPTATQHHTTTGGQPALAGSAPVAPPDSNADGSPSAGPSQWVGDGAGPVQTGPVQYVQQDVQYVQQAPLMSVVSALVTLTNPNAGWWLPNSDLEFAALDDRGQVVATYQTTVALGPGESKIAVAPTLVLGSSVHAVGSVKVALVPARWRPAATFVPTGLAVSAVQVSPGDGGTTVVTGQVANQGNKTENVQVSCALTAGGQLTGVGVGLLNDLLPATTSTFVVSVQSADGQPGTADCTADPAG